MSRLRIAGATKHFEEHGDRLTVFADLDITVADGEFVSLLGPSGCGKTTVLNVVAGLLTLDAGTVTLDGRPVIPGETPVGYVFQEPRLLNWRTVAQNVAFALEARGLPEAEREPRITRTLERVGLADEADSFPLRLSGGQRQRVNLARALALDPTLLLMDEPFSSLDEVTARHARRDLLDLWDDSGAAVLFVTHDIGEAVLLSDRILFMNEAGRIFRNVAVPHERPRELDDPALAETEAELTQSFFAELE